MGEHEEMSARLARAIDRVREIEARLGYAFQEGLITARRLPLTVGRLKSLEAALIRVAEILEERGSVGDRASA